MNILVTGGLGFIGSNFINLYSQLYPDHNIYNLDNESYAASHQNIRKDIPNYRFIKCDLANKEELERSLESIEFHRVFHFAAESHVDNSIAGPDPFIFSNIIGTYNLLNFFRPKKNIIFLHVSTDEVYGDLNIDDESFKETTPYNPSSPYSASKASSDLLVKSWFRTYGFPAIIVNCTNNFGPNQNIEKLIPKTITSALRGDIIPIYGKGLNIREWIYVEDFCKAIITVIEKGNVGETYNIGSGEELKNIEIVDMICNILGEKTELKSSKYKDLIKYVDDRLGHDFRYAVNSEKIRGLGWKTTKNIETAMAKTIDFYIDNS